MCEFLSHRSLVQKQISFQRRNTYLFIFTKQTSPPPTHTRMRLMHKRTGIAEGDPSIYRVWYIVDIENRNHEIYSHLELHRLRERRHHRFLEFRHYSHIHCIPWSVFFRPRAKMKRNARNASVYIRRYFSK